MKAVTKAVADPVVAAALLALVEQGCDREELLHLLARLRHSVTASRRLVKKLKRIARTLEHASAGVAELPQWRESGNLGIPGNAETWLLDCSHDLELLAAAIRSRLGSTDVPHDEARIDRAKIKVLQYVITQTGHPQDVEVATVIDAVLGSGSYPAAAHIKWRSGLVQPS